MNSRLGDLYADPAFQIEWDNDVRRHVGRQLLHLRRLRNMSQTEVANVMKTSQPAIARIEAGEENVTALTLQKFIGTVRGRLQLHILPEEWAVARVAPWWDAYSTATTMGWQLKKLGWMTDGHVERLAIGFERPAQTLESAVALLTEDATKGVLPDGKEAP